MRTTVVATFVVAMLLYCMGCGQQAPAPPQVSTLPPARTAPFSDPAGPLRIGALDLANERTSKGAPGISSDDNSGGPDSTLPGLTGRWLLTFLLEGEASQLWMVEISVEGGAYEAR